MPRYVLSHSVFSFPFYTIAKHFTLVNQNFILYVLPCGYVMIKLKKGKY
jgi:hypothetical protein